MFIAQTLSVLESAFLGFVVKEGGSIATSPNFTLSENIAKSEQSSHTPGGSHHRRLRSYHFNFLESKKNSTNKGTDKQMWLILLYIIEIVINEVLPSFKILGQVVPEKSLTKISIFILPE